MEWRTARPATVEEDINVEDIADEEDIISNNGVLMLSRRLEGHRIKLSPASPVQFSIGDEWPRQPGTEIDSNIGMTENSRKAVKAVAPQKALSITRAIKAAAEEFEVARPGGKFDMQYASAMIHLAPHSLTGGNDLNKKEVTRSDYKAIIESITGERHSENMAGQIDHGSTEIRKLYNAVRRKDGEEERRIIVPVVIHGEIHDTLVDTGASHSFINTSIVSMYGLRVEQGSGHIELADKSPIQRIGETERIEVTCGKYTVSAPFEVIEQKYAFAIGMDLFYRFGFSIIGLPDPEGPPEA
ncbi:unnamed protein product [Mortierella alpina]